MRKNPPLVSVALPVYNGERYLDDAITSILSQSLEDLELIITDNASTDGTRALCLAHAERDDRVRYERWAHNVGAAENFNRAFRLARGRYVKWAADDDVCGADYLRRCVDLLESDPEVVWSHSRMRFVDEQGGLHLSRAHGRAPMSYVVPGDPADGATKPPLDGPTRASGRPSERLRAVVLETVGDGNWDVFGVVRAEAARRTGLQRPYYGADKVFVGELALAGRYAEVPEALFTGRLHGAASGALGTATEQQEWIAPRARRILSLTRLRLVGAYLAAIAAADLDLAERAACLTVIARYLGQTDKWARVVRHSLQGRGTGGGYLEHLAPTPASGARALSDGPATPDPAASSERR